MTTYTDPSSSPSKESTAPQGVTPSAPEREKKSEKKLETPILVAIISAVVTLVTSILGSPVLLSMLDKPDQPATPVVTEYIVQNSLLPGGASGNDRSEVTSTAAESGAAPIESTATPPQEEPAPAPPSFFQCLASDVWSPYPATLNPGINDGCWDLAGWGFSTDQGQLILVHSPGQNEERGIYMPVTGDADIRFNVQLNEFRMRSNKGGFLNFGIVQNDPIEIYTGGYLSYQQPTPGTASPVRVLISGKKQATQKISTLEAGFRHAVLFSIQDDLLTISLDGEQTGDPVRLPPTDRAFWIGYVLPSKSELDVTITDFSIQTR